jgi:hypothetical protein
MFLFAVPSLTFVSCSSFGWFEDFDVASVDLVGTVESSSESGVVDFLSLALLAWTCVEIARTPSPVGLWTLPYHWWTIYKQRKQQIKLIDYKDTRVLISTPSQQEGLSIRIWKISPVFNGIFDWTSYVAPTYKSTARDWPSIPCSNYRCVVRFAHVRLSYHGIHCNFRSFGKICHCADEGGENLFWKAKPWTKEDVAHAKDTTWNRIPMWVRIKRFSCDTQNVTPKSERSRQTRDCVTAQDSNHTL